MNKFMILCLAIVAFMAFFMPGSLAIAKDLMLEALPGALTFTKDVLLEALSGKGLDALYN